MFGIMSKKDKKIKDLTERVDSLELFIAELKRVLDLKGRHVSAVLRGGSVWHIEGELSSTRVDNIEEKIEEAGMVVEDAKMEIANIWQAVGDLDTDIGNIKGEMEI